MLKKLSLGFLSILLLVGCSSKQKDAESVSSIQLEVMSVELYKGEPIEILMTVNSDYQLTEEDFNLFGGTIEIKNKHTAYITYNSAGTFHVQASVGDVSSNELTLQVKTNTGGSGNSTKPHQEQDKTDTTSQTTKKDPNDFSDWENVRDASDDKVTSADDFNANMDKYLYQDMIIEGNVPQHSDGTYIVTSDGTEIPLSGLEMSYAGTVRIFGTYDGETFRVKSYCAFGAEELIPEEKDKTEENNE